LETTSRFFDTYILYQKEKNYKTIDKIKTNFLVFSKFQLINKKNLAKLSKLYLYMTYFSENY